MVDKARGICEFLISILIEVASNISQVIQKSLAKHPIIKKSITATWCVLICSLLIMGFAVPRHVTVIIDDSIEVKTLELETTSKRVDSLFETHGIEFDLVRDRMDVDYYDPITDDMVIHITKEFEVQLTADGETIELHLLPTTVREVLEEHEIVLDMDDIVEPEIDEPLKDGDHIIVRRVMKTCEKEEVEIPYSAYCQADPNMTIGDMQVTQEGCTGKIEDTYMLTYVDGKETEREKVNSEVLREKKDRITGYGTKISFGKPAGLKYKEKIENVRAVSYHFSGNPRGVYGLPCQYGTVAVDRKLIPLGTKLYIEGYGYAIANDTGTAIKGKTVDLYMEKYEQCLLWGARKTTVYILD